MFHVRTLQRRFVAYMLLPVALLLVIMGTAGFIYARRTILAQWEEAAILYLQRTAHHVDMRLARPKEQLSLYLQFIEDHYHPADEQRHLLQELENRPGVIAVYVHLIRPGSPGGADRGHRDAIEEGHPRGHMAQMPAGKGGRHRFTITMPRFDPGRDGRTVSLVTRIASRNPSASSEIEVVLDFDYLLQDMPNAQWWRDQKTFITDARGRILVSTATQERRQLGETSDIVEVETLAALQKRASGTLRGPGHPPREVSGFYRLEEAPWYIVVIAPGEAILKPIIRFRTYYLLILATFIVIILMLIRRVTSGTTKAIKTLSDAAGDIAAGNFSAPLPVTSQDEIGGLTHSFNTMTSQLKDRLRLRQSLDLAKEVQQNLLPEKTPQVRGLDIAARSVYCEETGGDYFDYLPGGKGLHAVIGDVAGHGIASALLMSSVRAALRQKSTAAEELGALMAGVNRHVALDVGDSGRFVTLFYLVVEPEAASIEWVRAGHDPALYYRLADDAFEELSGQGLPLGVDPDSRFEACRREGIRDGDTIVLATDGIWEARDGKGQMFGKQALKTIIRKSRHLPATGIVDTVFAAVDHFVNERRYADDMTLVVVKVVETNLSVIPHHRDTERQRPR
ncbi:MAG: SpoIIE family protein phosphatase [Desulfobacterales bacterium]|jgi:sigma-B regulation protein RsbU (phosphoserine phosphatase)